MTMRADFLLGFQITTADLPKAIVLENLRLEQCFTGIWGVKSKNRLQSASGFGTEK
jgi:hypothetical protein